MPSLASVAVTTIAYRPGPLRQGHRGRAQADHSRGNIVIRQGEHGAALQGTKARTRCTLRGRELNCLIAFCNAVRCRGQGKRCGTRQQPPPGPSLYENQVSRSNCSLPS